MTDKKMPTFKQCRNWCFTDFKLLDIKSIYDEYTDIIRYIGWGEELCPKTQKKHYQGFIQFKNKKTMGGVKRIFKCKSLHLEPCRGSELQNLKYCSKDNKYNCFGKWIKQGHRSDLERIQKNIREGKNLDDVMESDFSTYCRYRNGIRDYHESTVRKNSKKFRKLEVEFVHGETETGKTRYAVEKFPEAYVINGFDLKWFDGYNGETELIIDEYNNDINITKLLKLLDGYQCRLPVKGSFNYANWNKVIITSNLTPDELHNQAKPAHKRALMRRIHKINKFEKVAEELQGNTELVARSRENNIEFNLDDLEFSDIDEDDYIIKSSPEQTAHA